MEKIWELEHFLSLLWENNETDNFLLWAYWGITTLNFASADYFFIIFVEEILAIANTSEHLMCQACSKHFVINSWFPSLNKGIIIVGIGEESEAQWLEFCSLEIEPKMGFLMQMIYCRNTLRRKRWENQNRRRKKSWHRCTLSWRAPNPMGSFKRLTALKVWNYLEERNLAFYIPLLGSY